MKPFWHLKRGDLPSSLSPAPPLYQSVHLPSEGGQEQVVTPPVATPWTIIAAPLRFGVYLCELPDSSADESGSSRYQRVTAGRCTELVFIIPHRMNLNNFHGGRYSGYFATSQNYAIREVFPASDNNSSDNINAPLKILFASLIPLRRGVPSKWLLLRSFPRMGGSDTVTALF